jgi:peptidoglycan/LPS O-acetylase OafA/YrhL
MKVLFWLVATVLVVIVLFTVVFPWFTARFVTDPVMDAGDPSPTTETTAATPAPTTEAAAPFQPTSLGEVTDY